MSMADRKLKLTSKLVTSVSVRARAAIKLVVNRSTVYYCIQSRVACYLQSWLGPSGHTCTCTHMLIVCQNMKQVQNCTGFICCL